MGLGYSPVAGHLLGVDEIPGSVPSTSASNRDTHKLRSRVCDRMHLLCREPDMCSTHLPFIIFPSQCFLASGSFVLQTVSGVDTIRQPLSISGHLNAWGMMTLGRGNNERMQEPLARSLGPVEQKRWRVAGLWGASTPELWPVLVPCGAWHSSHGGMLSFRGQCPAACLCIMVPLRHWETHSHSVLWAWRTAPFQN